MCQADFTFSQLNIHYKRFKFDLILNKSVRLQFQEEVKNIILKSLCLTVTLKIPWFIILTAALHFSLSIEEKIIRLQTKNEENFDQNFIWIFSFKFWNQTSLVIIFKTFWLFLSDFKIWKRKFRWNYDQKSLHS